MSRKSSITNNEKKISLYNKYKAKREELKNAIYDKSLSTTERFQKVCELSDLPRNSSKVRIRSLCKLTGRSRGFYRKFSLCRQQVLHLASNGLLPGVIMASW